jgi:uroporphyrinogen-III synthase
MSDGARRVLVTRPEEDAVALADALRDLAFEPVLEPLLSIHYRTETPVPLDGVQAIAFTSANGVRALALTDARARAAGLPAFAVGPATAKAAVEAGFETVESADGDVATLARLIAARCGGRPGAVLHPAGVVRAGNLGAVLEGQGIDVKTAPLYSAEPTRGLSASTARMIAAGEIGWVIIFSPRTARHFVSLLEGAHLGAAAGTMALAALSRAVAEAAAIGWREVVVAPEPNQAALLSRLQDAVGGKKDG